jgi:uncharacterized membrane-anchored protein YhcB (DUF1043 family)
MTKSMQKLRETLEKYFYKAQAEYNSSVEAIDQMLTVMQDVYNSIPHGVGKLVSKELAKVKKVYNG